MILYDYHPAPSPRRVRMFLAEKGIEIETRQIDLGAREQLGEAFRKINPRCTVPALALDDGAVLCDSMAITRYFEELRADPPMMGRDPLEKALVAEWIARCEQEGFFAVAEALRNKARSFADAALTGPKPYAQLPELAERGRTRAADFLDVLDERLSESAFLAGDNFSVADITGFIFVEFAGWVKVLPREDQTHLIAWHQAIKARPSASA